MYLLQINPILIASAVIPALLLLIYVYRLDRLEREPKGLIWSLILFGILATAVAGYFERIGIRILDLTVSSTTLYTILLTFLIVGPAEEGSKYLLLKWRTWRNPNFNCRFDAVVYAVAVSLGFAVWENLGYVAMLGIQGALIRAVTAIPGHASFAVFMGAWYGQAKVWDRAGDPQRSKQYRCLAVIIPTVIHALYDLIAMLGGLMPLIIFFAFIAAMFITAFVMLRRLAKRDRYL